MLALVDNPAQRPLNDVSHLFLNDLEVVESALRVPAGSLRQ
jgi:hypothetical protein